MVVQKLSSDVTWTLLGLICSEDWAAVWLLSTKPSSPSVLLDLPSQDLYSNSWGLHSSMRWPIPALWPFSTTAKDALSIHACAVCVWDEGCRCSRSLPLWACVSNLGPLQGACHTCNRIVDVWQFCICIPKQVQRRTL